MKLTSFVLSYILLLFIPKDIESQGNFIEKLSTDIHIQQTRKGKVSSVKADFHYQSNGKLVAHFSQPAEYILITNKKGEYQIYDPATKEVEQNQNPAFSAEMTFFGHFLAGRHADMGLNLLGFTLEDTKIENNITITTWRPQTVDNVHSFVIELVHEDYLPIFLAYKDLKNNILRKIYFYDYRKLLGLDIPATMTEINYIGKTDSIISRTQYTNFLINEQCNSRYFNFKIPSYAKLK